mgnify:CR=1 FL=1
MTDLRLRHRGIEGATYILEQDRSGPIKIGAVTLVASEYRMLQTSSPNHLLLWWL